MGWDALVGLFFSLLYLVVVHSNQKAVGFAQGSGGITILGGVAETWGCGTDADDQRAMVGSV